MKASQFINPQEAEERVTARYRVILILWASIFTSLGFLLALALFTPSSAPPNQTLTFIFLGIGFMVVIVSIFIKRRFVQRAIEQRQTALLQSGYIVAFALSESAALFGLLDHFINGSRYYYIGLFVAGLGMLLNFPKRDDVRATI